MKKRRRSSLAVPALLAALSLAGCATTRDRGCRPWTYANQAEWASLCTDGRYRACAGPDQSPRLLSPRTLETLPLIDPRYERSPFTVKNKADHFTIEAKPSGTGNRLVIGDDTYILNEIHFHNPSEHLVPGSGRPDGRYPVEIHLVHHNVKNEKELAAIGVFMVEVQGAPNNPAFEQILENVDKDEIQMDPALLLPPGQPRLDFRYLGSKTTPPCDAGVRWHVLAEPLVVPPIQIEALRRFYRGTARGPQRNGQRVFEPKPGTTP